MTDEAPAEAEAVVEEVSTGPREKFAISLIKIVSDAQGQHGLKYGDYQRYRQYCSRKLRRLRKALKFVHWEQGKGKSKFAQKVITAENCTDMRYVLMVLIKAERAWAYAMDLRNGNVNGPGREVHHLMRKLGKAVSYATMLEQICAATCDDRTALEAEAYSAWLAGSHALEREEWETGLEKLMRCRTVYDELSKVCDAEEQKVFVKQIEGIDPSIRYCEYNVAKAGGDTAASRSAQSLLLQMQQSSSSGATSDMLKAKLDRVLAKEQQAAGGTEVQWLGMSVPVLNATTHQLLVTAQRHHEEVGSAEGLEGKIELFDKMLMSLEDARKCIRADISENLKQGGARDANVTATLQLLRNYVQGSELLWRRERDLLLVESLQERLKANETGRKAAKPEDVVKLFETLLQSTEEYSAIEGIGQDENRSKSVAARTLMYKAWRVLFIGEAYLAAGKVNEAGALVERAKELEKVARKRFTESGHLDDVDKTWLDKLQDLSGRRQMQVRAHIAEKSVGGFVALPAEGSKDKATKALANQPLLQRMSNYEAAVYGEAGKIPKLVDFPPPIDAVACKPVLFDLALNHIDYPSLDDRIKKKGGGGILGWFSKKK